MQELGVQGRKRLGAEKGGNQKQTKPQNTPPKQERSQQLGNGRKKNLFQKEDQQHSKGGEHPWILQL